MKFILPILVTAMLLPALAQSSTTRLIVITHPENALTLTREDVYRIYHGKSLSFPNGQKALPIILDESSADHITFTEQILKRSPSQFKSYWAKKLFTGKGKPPKTVNNIEAMVEFVSRNPNVIGYLLTDESIDGVHEAFELTVDP